MGRKTLRELFSASWSSRIRICCFEGRVCGVFSSSSVRSNPSGVKTGKMVSLNLSVSCFCCEWLSSVNDVK